MSLEIEYSTIGDFGEVVMGMSPKGDTYNEEEEGLPLLNGPTEFGSSHPIPSLFTTDSKRESNIGDLIFCVRGSTTGRMNWANQIYSLGRGVCAIRGKTDNDTKYIKYVLDVKLNSLLKFAGGGTFPNLKKDDIKDFKIPILKEKDKLVSIISAYDDLIENNLKRIKLLEQAAQNIYKEWFVNLRFPGHENTPINEETGLPEGWGEKGLCEFASFVQYKVKIKKYEGEKEYLATANVDGIKISEQGEYFSFDKKPSRAQIAPPLNSVWFARMSNTEKVLCFTENTNNDLMISSGFAGFKAEEKEFLPFLFCTINSDVFSKLKDSYATGSTQVSINNKSINSIRFIEPKIQTIKEFGEKIYPSLEMINKLFVTNKKLKAARDIMLPRLMNRTIEV
ncbi:restriction endonuclease subunit S [Flavobacteriaceae bacterium]|nr:restriction endonuclease subunit S [Flavobacteriaceae bacterium]MDC3265539.1 restriction endonuclease subunit S [Flavobacteriaceae bacterium]